MEINFQTVKAAILASGVDGDLSALEETTTFESVGVDSLDTFTILLSVEENFGVTIPEERVEELNTIAKLVEYLKS